MSSALLPIAVDSFFVIAAAIIIVPSILYLFTTWSTRRDNLLGYLGKTSIVLYYEQFFRTTTVTEDTACDTFAKDFSRRYGLPNYALPLFMLALLTMVLAAAADRMLQPRYFVMAFRSFADLTLPGSIIASSIAGAFVWVVNDSLSRLRRRDLNPIDIYGWTFRLLIAAPFGWAITRVAAQNVAIPVAFLLGAFPTRTLLTIGRRLAATQLKLADDPATGQSELESLPSVTKANAERFNDEDVMAIAQLAYSDPVDLTIRTNFDFSYVTDCISQALLWIYVGKNLATLALYSVRDAQEVAALVDALADPDPQRSDQAKATLAAIADTLQVKLDAIKTTLEQVALDPYTKFLTEVW